MKKYSKGFTLIELLVVISIISFLSSIILNSVNSARTKAKDSAIIESLKQFEILLTLEYNETKSYAGLQPGLWATANYACSAAPYTSTNYSAKAKDLCTSITSNSPQGSGTYFYAGSSNAQKYSVMALINNGPNATNYYCVGSSGSSVDSGGFSGVGCYNNP